MALCRSRKGPWLDIRSGILILGLPPCRAMRNTYFINLPFSDTLQPWTTMTWAASCPLSFISPKGDQASVQLRLLVIPQNDEGVQYMWETKKCSIPWPALAMRLLWAKPEHFGNHDNYHGFIRKAKVLCHEKHPGQSISDFIHSTTCYWLSIF